LKESSLFRIGSVLVVGFCIGLAGCAQAPSEAPDKPLPTVTVGNPLQREVTDYQDYTGRTAAVDSFAAVRLCGQFSSSSWSGLSRLPQRSQ
jgi:hypothetical protein